MAPAWGTRFERSAVGRDSMVEPGVDFASFNPEYYDSCLGPAWFDALGADLALRLPTRPPGDVLEIACGTGRATRRLRERLDPTVRLVASDLSKAMLSFARCKLNDCRGIEW